MMVPWPGRGVCICHSKMAQARRPIRRGNVMKVEVFLRLQLWLTRWDAVESSCLKWKISLNILEHTSCQELTCNPFLNWTGLGKSILATSSLAIDSWDHFESLNRDRMDILVRLDCFGPWETHDVTDVHSEDFNFFKRLLRTRERGEKRTSHHRHLPMSCLKSVTRVSTIR